jgi:hypothetical protein
MKTKVVRGAGFRGWSDYALDNKGKGAEIIGGNMDGTDSRSLSAEFGLFRELRPSCERPLVHFSLSAAPGETLSNDQWEAVAADFMKHMDLSENAHVVIRHFGTNNDHIHIGGCRIGSDGELWHGQWEARKAIAATQRIERDHGLILTPGLEDDEDTAPGQEAPAPGSRSVTKSEIEQADRTGNAPARMRLQEIVGAALDQPQTIFAFIDQIEAAGVTVIPNVATTGRMNGFSFEIDGIPFKGSQLGKAFGWKAIQERGVEYEQDRDGESLVTRADEIKRGIVAERAGESAGVDPEAGPTGAGLEHDQPEVRRELGRDGTNAGDSDREPTEDPFAGYGDDHGGIGGGVQVPATGAEIPAGITRPGDAAGSDDIDGAVGRISDLAAAVDPDDVADGPVPALTPAQKAKALSWDRQSTALGAPEYRLTLKSRKDDLASFSLGKGKGPEGVERFYTPESVADLIPYLSRQNLLGRDIYITPIDKAHHYLVIDDATPEGIAEMRVEGFSPALVQESSAGNVQAILKIPRRDEKGEQKAANQLVVTLNKKWGDDAFSGVIHPFRMAGFANKKPGRDNAFTRVLEAAGTICDHAATWLARIRDRIRAAQAPSEPLPAPTGAERAIEVMDAPEGPPDARFDALWRQHVRLADSKGWEINLSAIDYRVAGAMINESYTVAEISGAMRRRSPDIETRHPEVSAYIERTLGNAGRPKGRPEVTRDEGGFDGPT